VSRYRETLHKWAAKYVPEGAKVVAVDVENDPGYRYSSYTYEDPHIDVTVRYELPGDVDGYDAEGNLVPSYARTATVGDVENLGEILTQLFAIEDEEDARG
jgi:hypothetical protein